MQQPIQQQISLDQSTGIICECGGIFFRQAILLRKFSKLLVGSPTDQFVPVAVFLCDSCGKPTKDLFPEGMQDVEEKLGWNKVRTITNDQDLKIIR